MQALIGRALRTMVHVELLLLLHRTAPTASSVAAAATELRDQADLVTAAFTDLEQSGLAARGSSAGAPEWQLAVSNDQLLEATTALRELYDRRPVTLVKALHSRPAAPQRAFADAFRLWRGWRRSRARLLLWSTACFAGLALNNVLLIVDTRMLRETDLALVRLLPALVGAAALIYGLVWDAE